MSLPDIVAAAFGLYRRYPVTFLLLALPQAVLSVGVSAGSAALGGALNLNKVNADQANQTQNASTLPRLIAWVAVFVFATLVVDFFADAFIVPAALEAHGGRRPEVKRALQRWRVIAAAALLAGVLAGVRITLAVATLFLAPLAVYLYFRWCLAVPALCAEGGGGLSALRRSQALVKGSWWRVAGVSLGIFVLAALPGILVQPLVSATSSDIAGLALVFLAAWLGIPFAAIGRTLLYTDMRLRKGERDEPPRPVAV